MRCLCAVLDVIEFSGDIPMRHYGQRFSTHRGLSLLEVILSIAILGGALAMVGELVRIGVRAAENARGLTNAQMLCESKLAEITAGIVPTEAVQLTPIQTTAVIPEWYYSVEIAQSEQEGLIIVRVSVFKEPNQIRTYPVVFSLTRLMIDPGIEFPEDEAETTETEDGSGELTAESSS